ncbi:MAG: cytochrome c oxidase assembly protein [Caulobacteraceae bacterium]|nr:cytochrome c oxidase assembly protein [Caulobacteraceae bacterium]
MTRNARLALICLVAAFGMVGAAYAAVPLYRVFCQVTGFDGTVKRAKAAPTRTLDRPMTVRFDTNVSGVPFTFEPEVRQQEIKVGKPALAFFRVTNTADHPVTAQAVYNVVPEAAGAYFEKLECFCFTEQTLQPGQTVEFPMTYFVDPKLAEDHETRGIQEVTLSYTFYPAVASSGAPRPPGSVSNTSGLGGKPAKGL